MRKVGESAVCLETSCLHGRDSTLLMEGYLLVSSPGEEEEDEEEEAAAVGRVSRV